MNRDIYKYFSLSVFVVCLLGCAEAPPSEKESDFTIQLISIDSTSAPADNFYDFVNGNWLGESLSLKENETWDILSELERQSLQVQRIVLEEAYRDKDLGKNTDEWKAATFYFIGMDSLRAESQKFSPLKYVFNRINNILSKDQLYKYLAFEDMKLGNALVNVVVQPDKKRGLLFYPSVGVKTILLPGDSIKREEYRAQLRSTLREAGFGNEDSLSYKIMAFEDYLSKGKEIVLADTSVQMFSIDSLAGICPAINWRSYGEELGLPGDVLISVENPAALLTVDSILAKNSLKDIKSYLKWKALEYAAPYLHNEVSERVFQLKKILNPNIEWFPRWYRVLSVTNKYLGSGVGKLYIDREFSAEGKLYAEKMTDNLMFALVERIKTLHWMSDSTRENILKELQLINTKVGYPDNWSNHNDLIVEGDLPTTSYFENIMLSNFWQYKNQIKKLGSAIDTDEWISQPQETDIVFHPVFKELLIPAGILQPPFFDANGDAAINYGTIGGWISRVLSSVFDPTNLNDEFEGWIERDSLEYIELRNRLADQYSSYMLPDSTYLMGDAIIGENIVDLAGFNIALAGFQRYIKLEGSPGVIKGLTPKERFMIGWAAMYRTHYPGDYSNRISTPAEYRVNGTLANIDAFYRSFDVNSSHNFYIPDSMRITIW